jgi:predicted permease
VSSPGWLPAASALPGELRWAARRLARNPFLTGVALLVIGLGLGAGAATFGLADAVLLHPLPLPRPDRLVELTGFAAYPDYLDLRQRCRSFSGLAAYDLLNLVLGPEGQEQAVVGALVSDDYFAVLGAGMTLGRGFLREEALPSAAPVAVLSHELWRREFAADPRLPGKIVEVNGLRCQVVGIAARGFRGTYLGAPTDLWLPVTLQPRISAGGAGDDRIGGRKSRWLRVVGRLRDGAGAAAAAASARGVALQLAAENGDDRGAIDTRLVPLRQAATGLGSHADVVRFVGMLVGVVGALLLLTSANLANLLSLQALVRRKEMAVRMALGASRPALVRQLLLESWLLGVLGAALAVLVDLGANRLLVDFELPGGIPLEALDLAPNPRLLLFTLALGVATATVFGVAPAFHAVDGRLQGELTQTAGSPSRGMARLRSALVALQVALCLLLLIGGGLFAASLRRALTADLGFASHSLAVASVDLGRQQYGQAEAAELYRLLLERLDAAAGVRSASLVRILPLGASHWRTSPRLPGRPGTQDLPEVFLNVIGGDYLATMGIPLLRGRVPAPRDDAGGVQVALINETMARLFWAGQDPLGQRIVPFPKQPELELEIIGVVKDSTSHRLGERPVPFLMVPFSQRLGQRHVNETVNVVVRAAHDPRPVLALLRHEIRALDPRLSTIEPRTFDDDLAGYLLPQRFGLRLLGALAALALLEAAVGLYGVLAYGVRQRARELGVRAALGARSHDLRRLVLRRALGPVVAGLALGLAAALATTRLLASFLYGIQPGDPTVLASTSLLLLAVALAAAYLPARRAGRLAVMDELRR